MPDASGADVVTPSRFLAAVPPDEDDDPSAPGKHWHLKYDRRTGKHRPESLEHAVKIAWCDWAAGLVIGLMPLLCHLLLH